MTLHKRIVVVEDDPIFRSILEGNLKFEGYQVQAVASGEAALAIVDTFRPDLLILDLTLPDRDGLELCPMLQRNGRIPIIILSARSQRADKLKGSIWVRRTTLQSPLTSRSCSRGFELYFGALRPPRSISFPSVAS
jgi:DNA-binding response OmpR family regulator